MFVVCPCGGRRSPFIFVTIVTAHRVPTNGTYQWLRTVPVLPVKRSPEARGWLLTSSEGATKAQALFSVFSGITETNFSVDYHLILVDIRAGTVGSTGVVRLPVFGARWPKTSPSLRLFQTRRMR
jgi:hypothetical protein